MSVAVNWIGGTTVVALVLLGSAVIAGHSLEAGALDEREAHFEPQASIDAHAPKLATVEAEAVAEPAALVIRSVLPIQGPIRYGEWHWDESRAPSEGPLIMTVDLDARVMSVFRDGHEIGATAVLLGTPQHPTPTGVFPILAKQRHNTSSIYNNAPMPWTMRLTWDGIAIHGGSTVERGYASHGCISAPDPFVSRLFAIAEKGDTVIITRGKKAELGTPLAPLS